MERLLRALGLCAKAGKLVVGTPMICQALAEKKKPFLTVVAKDNSENTAKRLNDRCAYYGVRAVTIPAGGEELARAVGKTGKIAAAAVTDENLCRLVSGILEEEHII